MLVHRKVDEIKRQGSWITKLHDVTIFAVQTTSAVYFSLSKDTALGEEMKKRALDQILPSIFDVAQAYEEHITQHNLFEGSGNVAPGRGKQHTWKPIPKTARRQLPKRRRQNVTDGRAVVRETICEVSGNETEPDDTMVRLARPTHGLPQPVSSPRPTTALGQVETQSLQQSTTVEDSHRQTWELDTTVSASAPCMPVAPQEEYKMHCLALTPNSSFDQPLHGLHLEEEHIETKPYAQTIPDPGNTNARYYKMPYSQPIQYLAAPTGSSGQIYWPTNNHANPEPFSDAQDSTTLISPSTMFNAPKNSLGYTQYASTMSTAIGFPHNQGVSPPTPMSFSNTQMSIPMTPSDPDVAYHSLPSVYRVDSKGYVCSERYY